MLNNDSNEWLSAMLCVCIATLTPVDGSISPKLYFNACCRLIFSQIPRGPSKRTFQLIMPLEGANDLEVENQIPTMPL